MRRKPSDARHLLVMVKCRLHSTYIGMLPAEKSQSTHHQLEKVARGKK
jgi:hypothetical protein